MFQNQKSIVITQPRRISAISVAERVAFEMNEKIGSKVGYEVRFQSNRSSETKVIFLTEAILIREAVNDPVLSNYNVVIIDEAHERGINSDLLLGLIIKMLKKRSDLRVVVMSATLETQKILNFFVNNTKKINYKCISVNGRFHPIEIHNLDQSVSDYLEAALNTILQIHDEPEKGDIIVFLTGQEEIEELDGEIHKKMIEHEVYFASKPLIVVQLFSALPPEKQQLAFSKFPNFRKVILSTNIAETAVTIEGIRFVIDSGFVKLKFFDERKGVELLAILPVSKASATQRAGRAGRLEKGKCYRLYTQKDYEQLADFNEPVS